MFVIRLHSGNKVKVTGVRIAGENVIFTCNGIEHKVRRDTVKRIGIAAA